MCLAPLDGAASLTNSRRERPPRPQLSDHPELMIYARKLLLCAVALLLQTHVAGLKCKCNGSKAADKNTGADNGTCKHNRRCEGDDTPFCVCHGKGGNGCGERRCQGGKTGDACDDDTHCLNKRCVENECVTGDQCSACEKETDCDAGLTCEHRCVPPGSTEKQVCDLCGGCIKPGFLTGTRPVGTTTTTATTASALLP